MRLEEIRLDRHAEATWFALERMRPEATKAAKGVLLALTTPEGTRATRTMEEITAIAGPAAEQIAESFSSAGLIVASGRGLMFSGDGLITHWGRLREWLEAGREDRLFAQELERDAKRWLADADAVPLWQKRRLASAEALCRRGDVYISAGAMAFLRTSQRAERRVRAGIAMAAALIGLSPVAAGFAYWKATAQEISQDSVPAHQQESPKPVVAEEEPPGRKLSADANVQAARETTHLRVPETGMRPRKNRAGTAPAHTSRPDAAPAAPASLSSEPQPSPITSVSVPSSADAGTGPPSTARALEIER
jgi:hypothetical protein